MVTACFNIPQLRRFGTLKNVLSVIQLYQNQKPPSDDEILEEEEDLDEEDIIGFDYEDAISNLTSSGMDDLYELFDLGPFFENMPFMNFEEEFQGWKSFYDLISPFSNPYQAYVKYELKHKSKKKKKSPQRPHHKRSCPRITQRISQNIVNQSFQSKSIHHRKIPKSPKRKDISKDNLILLSKAKIRRIVDIFSLMRANIISSYGIGAPLNADSYEMLKFIFKHRNRLMPLIDYKHSKLLAYIHKLPKSMRELLLKNYHRSDEILNQEIKNVSAPFYKCKGRLKRSLSLQFDKYSVARLQYNFEDKFFLRGKSCQCTGCGGSRYRKIQQRINIFKLPKCIPILLLSKENIKAFDIKRVQQRKIPSLPPSPRNDNKKDVPHSAHKEGGLDKSRYYYRSIEKNLPNKRRYSLTKTALNVNRSDLMKHSKMSKTPTAQKKPPEDLPSDSFLSTVKKLTRQKSDGEFLLEAKPEEINAALNTEAFFSNNTIKLLTHFFGKKQEANKDKRRRGSFFFARARLQSESKSKFKTPKNLANFLAQMENKPSFFKRQTNIKKTFMDHKRRPSRFGPNPAPPKKNRSNSVSVMDQSDMNKSKDQNDQFMRVNSKNVRRSKTFRINMDTKNQQESQSVTNYNRSSFQKPQSSFRSNALFPPNENENYETKKSPFIATLQIPNLKKEEKKEESEEESELDLLDKDTTTSRDETESASVVSSIQNLNESQMTLNILPNQKILPRERPFSEEETSPPKRNIMKILPQRFQSCYQKYMKIMPVKTLTPKELPFTYRTPKQKESEAIHRHTQSEGFRQDNLKSRLGRLKQAIHKHHDIESQYIEAYDKKNDNSICNAFLQSTPAKKNPRKQMSLPKLDKNKILLQLKKKYQNLSQHPSMNSNSVDSIIRRINSIHSIVPINCFNYTEANQSCEVKSPVWTPSTSSIKPLHFHHASSDSLWSNNLQTPLPFSPNGTGKSELSELNNLLGISPRQTATNHFRLSPIILNQKNNEYTQNIHHENISNRTLPKTKPKIMSPILRTKDKRERATPKTSYGKFRSMPSSPQFTPMNKTPLPQIQSLPSNSLANSTLKKNQSTKMSLHKKGKCSLDLTNVDNIIHTPRNSGISKLRLLQVFRNPAKVSEEKKKSPQMSGIGKNRLGISKHQYFV